MQKWGSRMGQKSAGRIVEMELENMENDIDEVILTIESGDYIGGNSYGTSGQSEA